MSSWSKNHAVPPPDAYEAPRDPHIFQFDAIRRRSFVVPGAVALAAAGSHNQAPGMVERVDSEVRPADIPVQPMPASEADLTLKHEGMVRDLTEARRRHEAEQEADLANAHIPGDFVPRPFDAMQQAAEDMMGDSGELAA